jgi:hypothetical protein
MNAGVEDLSSCRNEDESSTPPKRYLFQCDTILKGALALDSRFRGNDDDGEFFARKGRWNQPHYDKRGKGVAIGVLFGHDTRHEKQEGNLRLGDVRLR